jgi:glycosyltransferase involved in cell wall biosynthesis
MIGQDIKVAMFCPFFLPAYGGAELATLNLAKELKKMSDVRLYTFNWPSNLDKERKYRFNFSFKSPKQEIIDGIPIYQYSVSNFPLIKNFSLKLLRDIKSYDPDIIHIQGASRLFSRLLLHQSLKKKKKVLTTHGLQESIEIVNHSTSRVFVNSLFVNSLTNLDHIIALSSTDIKSLINLGVRKNKISLISNGIDVEKFLHRRNFIKNNGKTKILCVARFDKNKNYESLVLALNKLKNELEFEAYFIGSITDVQYFEKIMALIKNNGLEKIIKIFSSLDDPALVDCYLSCDLFVLPSLVETLPLVILEAMYAGLPIIATNVGGIPDIITNYVNGFVVPRNDFVQLFEKCLLLMKNKEMRKNMSKKNKELAKKYSWKEKAFSTFQLYQNLLSIK